MPSEHALIASQFVLPPTSVSVHSPECHAADFKRPSPAYRGDRHNTGQTVYTRYILYDTDFMA